MKNEKRGRNQSVKGDTACPRLACSSGVGQWTREGHAHGDVGGRVFVYKLVTPPAYQHSTSVATQTCCGIKIGPAFPVGSETKRESNVS